MGLTPRHMIVKAAEIPFGMIRERENRFSR
jgi:hypothetical protein